MLIGRIPVLDIATVKWMKTFFVYCYLVEGIECRLARVTSRALCIDVSTLCICTTLDDSEKKNVKNKNFINSKNARLLRRIRKAITPTRPKKHKSDTTITAMMTDRDKLVDGEGGLSIGIVAVELWSAIRDVNVPDDCVDLWSVIFDNVNTPDDCKAILSQLSPFQPCAQSQRAGSSLTQLPWPLHAPSAEQLNWRKPKSTPDKLSKKSGLTKMARITPPIWQIVRMKYFGWIKLQISK